ncbi:MAG TPA: hypothetical protein VE967_05385 [Gemmatimonadaceae bacterium]|nr:hypothetical protein [Gemmatimonadaceae bacterium]
MTQLFTHIDVKLPPSAQAPRGDWIMGRAVPARAATLRAEYTFANHPRTLHFRVGVPWSVTDCELLPFLRDHLEAMFGAPVLMILNGGRQTRKPEVNSVADAREVAASGTVEVSAS